jgi:hypothetical protein
MFLLSTRDNARVVKAAFVPSLISKMLIMLVVIEKASRIEAGPDVDVSMIASGVIEHRSLCNCQPLPRWIREYIQISH